MLLKIQTAFLTGNKLTHSGGELNSQLQFSHQLYIQ